MSLKKWEKKVLKAPGAARRVSEIERELRIAAGLAGLREDAGMSQRELAKRIGVSQPRVAAIERSENVTIDVLQQYVESLGAELEVTAVKGSKKIALLSSAQHRTRPALPKESKKVAARSVARKSSTRRSKA